MKTPPSTQNFLSNSTETRAGYAENNFQVSSNENNIVKLLWLEMRMIFMDTDENMSRQNLKCSLYRTKYRILVV